MKKVNCMEEVSEKEIILCIEILGTGSKVGNSILINDEICFDIGVSNFKDNFLISRELIDTLKLKTIIISHPHEDHIKGMNLTIKDDFLNLSSVIYPKLYDQNINSLKKSQKIFFSNIPISLSNKKPDNCIILLEFDVGHDILNYGYVILYKNKLIMYATDIGNKNNLYIGYHYNKDNNEYIFYTINDLKNNINISYIPFDFYIIECNWDNNDLKDKKNKPENRNNKYHLSNSDCSIFLNYIKSKPTLLVHRRETFFINEKSYFFMKEYSNRNVYIAINKYEKHKFSNEQISEFRLVNDIKIKI